MKLEISTLSPLLCATRHRRTVYNLINFSLGCRSCNCEGRGAGVVYSIVFDCARERFVRAQIHTYSHTHTRTRTHHAMTTYVFVYGMYMHKCGMKSIYLAIKINGKANKKNTRTHQSWVNDWVNKCVATI